MKYWFFTIYKTAKCAEVSGEFALEILQAHTAYFKELGKKGKCMFAGPFADQTTELGGGLYGFACETEEARELADKDPLAIEGLYSYKIYEWKKVVPE